MRPSARQRGHFSCRTVPYLCKGKKSRPCKGQATGWSLTYSGARRAVGPGAAACADLPLLRRPSAQAPHLGPGPGRAKEAGRRTRPCRSLPDPRPHPFALGGAALATGSSQGAAARLGDPRNPRSPRHRRRLLRRQDRVGEEAPAPPAHPHSPGRARWRAWRKRTS